MPLSLLLAAGLALSAPLAPGAEGQPPEAAMRPSNEVTGRKTDAPEAPEVDGCGGERFAELDRPAIGGGRYDRAQVTFAVQFKDQVSPYRLMSFFVLPGETVELEAVLTDRASRFHVCTGGGELEPVEDDEWLWTAPDEPGIYPIYLSDVHAGETMKLNAFVMVPYAGEERLEGYRIGSYERVPLRGNPVYDQPRGMIEVQPSMLDVWLSPHFQLRQFVCKQKSDFPKFLIVGERLLLKLELLLQEVNEHGIEADTFSVLSGYRTPWYNVSIGNRTRYSRHLYGDAADIYVDRDEDGRMDDLNGDGKSDMADARVLSKIVEGSVEEAWYRPFIGGLGLYGPAPHRGPFIHVDTRGFPARWSS